MLNNFVRAKGVECSSSVDLLEYEGRVNEIARILGGIHVTEAQMNAAREMIEEGRAY